MLVSHSPIKRTDPILSIIAVALGKTSDVLEVATGVYEISHFGSSDWPSGVRKHDYRDSVDHYWPINGVCDNWEQIIEAYPEINDVSKKHCITLTPIIKANEESPGGWRWHKWGEYIGTKDPQYEYIADEGPAIEKVYVFTVYEIL